MEIKKVTEKVKETFNKATGHPLQSWEWGEFRKEAGNEVIRFSFSQRTSNPPSRFIIDIPEDLLEGVENNYLGEFENIKL